MKLIRLVYNYLRWDLVHLSVFMFDQVRVWSKNEWDFYVMSVLPLVFDRVIEKEVTEFQIKPLIIIGMHVRDWIMWNVDSHHSSLEFDAIFESNKPNINVINNTRRK